MDKLVLHNGMMLRAYACVGGGEYTGNNMCLLIGIMVGIQFWRTLYLGKTYVAFGWLKMVEAMQ